MASKLLHVFWAVPFSTFALVYSHVSAQCSVGSRGKAKNAKCLVDRPLPAAVTQLGAGADAKKYIVPETENHQQEGWGILHTLNLPALHCIFLRRMGLVSCVSCREGKRQECSQASGWSVSCRQSYSFLQAATYLFLESHFLQPPPFIA